MGLFADLDIVFRRNLICASEKIYTIRFKCSNGVKTIHKPDKVLVVRG